MVIVVEVSTQDAAPSPGTPLRVEVRDTTLADAPAVTLGSATGEVRGHGGWLETLEVEAADVPRGSTVWAHVDVDRDGRVSPGDLLTTAAYEVPPGEQPHVSVLVTRI